MNETITLGLNKDEIAQLSAIVEACVVAMRQAHEQMAQDQLEIDRLKASTQAKLAAIERQLNVETTF